MRHSWTIGFVVVAAVAALWAALDPARGGIATLLAAIAIVIATLSSPASADPAQALSELRTQYLEGLFRAKPHLASFMGDHRFDGKLPDLSAAALKRRTTELVKQEKALAKLPRAALTAGAIAAEAEFFSFGTNDLTQTTFGISRDDAGKFIPQYVEQEIYADDPFTTLDREGVGRLMRIACDEGRAARADLKLGICGEHGGDPRSIAFCQELGLAYVSCSPFRVPIARLAAAQAALKARG